ncbi:histidine kinase [Paenibacillus sp. Marseille-Q4541]|uniref:sensor histidine kinase n=1 Tax=Paenibacillus sp. Marseille-Q4541 TaxID=2831522 RepID=UPI001BA63895
MFRLTYYRRIQLSFLLFIIVPIIAVSVISFVLIKQTMVEKLQLTNNNFLNVMVNELGKTIDDVAFASHFIVNDSNFRTYLRNFANTSRLNNYDDYTQFSNIKGVFSLINSKPLNNNIRMYLVNREQFVISSDENDPNLIRGDLDYLFDQIRYNEPETLQWLGMVRNGQGKGTYYISRIIQDSKEDEYLSVLFIGISEAYFEELFAPIEFGKVALFDAKGNRIAGSTELNPTMLSTDEKNLRTEVALDRTDWNLVYEASKQAFTGKISATFYIGIACVLLFMIIFSISSMYIAKRLHSPVQKLKRVVRQFGHGNLSVRLEIKGKDDMAELSHTLNTMLDQLEHLVHDIKQEQEEKRVMEMDALVMQIRPHFLMNTLNSIKCSLILQKDHFHSGVVDSLMSLLRAYLKVGEPTTIQEECDLLEHYIEIMQVRNDIPIELDIELDDDVRSVIIPKLLMQPLIENAVVHGLLDQPDACIHIQARREHNLIVIEIEDNGCGMEDLERERLNTRLQASRDHSSYERVGLVNVSQRLRLYYGPNAIMSLQSNLYGGITTVIQIPVQDGVTSKTEGTLYA